MVRLEKHGDSAVRFIFTDSDHYLYKDGVVDVPVNSLSLVIDESEMVTFKKASTADPFISFRLDKSNFSSRDELLTFYKENMVGAGGISEEEVQQMIDAATSGIPSSQVIEQLRNDVNAVSGDVENKIDTTTYESGQYATAQALNALQENKLDASAYTPTDLSEYWTSGQTQEAINAATSGIPSSQVIEQLQTDVNNLQGETNDIWDTIDEKEEVIASALTQLNQDVADIDAKEEVIASALTEVRQDVDKKAGVCYVDFWGMFNDEYEMDDAKWDEMVEAYNNNAIFYAIPKEGTETNASPLIVDYQSGIGFQFIFPWGAGYTRLTLSRIEDGDGYEYVVSDTEDYYFEVDTTLDSGSTNPVQNAVITQALNNKLDASAYTPTDLSEYWTSGQTQNAINAATSGKADTSAVTQVNNVLTAHTANTTVHVTSAEKDAWNAKANIDHVTQVEYDAMVTAGTLDSNTMYIIDDAVPFDPSTKQDVLSAGTGISISNNVISTSGVVMSQTVTQLVKLTQAAYDALATKDSSTLYIISD